VFWLFDRLPEIGENPIFFYFTIIQEVVSMKQRRAVVSVIGKDQVGIIAKVTNILADNSINILDISQTILQDFFTMMMLVDVAGKENLEVLQTQFDEVSEEMGLKINIQLEEIFQAMHRI
jgi:ACT domain-containing protein